MSMNGSSGIPRQVSSITRTTTKQKYLQQPNPLKQRQEQQKNPPHNEQHQKKYPRRQQ